MNRIRSGEAIRGRFRRCVACGRRKFAQLRETFDAVDHCVIGRQRCTACRQVHLYARRLTLAETRVVQRHLQPIRR